MPTSLKTRKERTMLFYIVYGLFAYLVTGYLAGIAKHAEFSNRTNTENLGLLGKAKRLLFFPDHYYSWQQRKDSFNFECHQNRDGYIRMTTYVWPVTVFFVGIGGMFCILFYVLTSLVSVLTSLVSGILGTPGRVLGWLRGGAKVPGFLARRTRNVRFRDKLKALLGLTWGQSILTAIPLAVFGLWWVAALNIVASWLGFKYGLKALINTYKTRASGSLVQAIDDITQFKNEKLDEEESRFTNLMKEIESHIKSIKEKISETKRDIERLKTAQSREVGGFELLLQQLGERLGLKETNHGTFAKILEKIRLTSGQLQDKLRLIEGHRFLQELDPSGQDNTQAIVSDAYALIDSCQKLISSAHSTEVSHLCATASVAVEEIGKRVDDGVVADRELTERGINLLLDQVSPEAPTVAARQAVRN